MARVRHDVWNLGAGWSEPLLWYAKAVRAMQARPVTDPKSWRFQAAMHGMQVALWTAIGVLKPGEALPDGPTQRKYWGQCQHQTWYFLPWHRGYLAAFEGICRADIVAAGGPADWALPYWNYNNPDVPQANGLPPAFAATSLPDGSANPLFVERRYGDGEGPIVLDQRAIGLIALSDDQFTGGAEDVHPGFGGPTTLFHHGGEDRKPNGGLEGQPHNPVHGMVGGTRPGGREDRAADGGLMSWPEMAALDPVFWLHHANIDRLWEVWRQMDGHANPADAPWLRGPAGRAFVLPLASGADWTFTSKDVLDTTAPDLDYQYEDISPPLTLSRLSQRMERLGVGGEEAQGAAVTTGGSTSELIGSNETSLSLQGAVAETAVRVDPAAAAAMSTALDTLSPQMAREPDRVFLKLENIRGHNDSAVFYVYVGLAADAKPDEHPELLAGTLSLFGVSKASDTSDGKGGNGIDQVFEITHVVDSLHMSDRLAGLSQLPVRFVANKSVGAESRISVGRVSLFRRR